MDTLFLITVGLYVLVFLMSGRVWSMSLEDCETQAKEFARSRPRYITRKGVFIYKLAEEKELIKVLT